MLSIGDEDVNIAAIQILEAEIRGLANVWDEATEAKFSYLNGDSNRFADHTKAIEKSRKSQNLAYAENRRQQVQDVKDRFKARQDLEMQESMKTKFRLRKKHYGIDSSTPEEDRIKKVADAQNRAWAENRGRTVMDAMEKNAANQKALDAIKQQREQLALIGIDSKSIATTIGDTWVNGIRAGNSLLQITKDSFKNILASIAETMLRKSIEYGVELLFQTLLGKKIDKEKQITSEKRKQLFLTLATSAAGGGGGGKSWFGMNKGGIVPGGAPYTDRVPTMLTPGEVVIPRNKVNNSMRSSNITNINISGNVDQRAIDQIKGIIGQSTAEVGGANRTFQRNSQGVRGRGR
jgi:hypothetical protein